MSTASATANDVDISHAEHSAVEEHGSGEVCSHIQQYMTGIILAIVLTAIPFALVAEDMLSRSATIGLIAITGAIQMLVHMRYFLHLSFSRKDQWFVISIAFTGLIVALMIGGTLWVLVDLNQQMMPVM